MSLHIVGIFWPKRPAGTSTAHVQVAQSEVPKLPKDWAGGNIQPFKLVSLSKLSLFLTIFVFAVYANLFQLE